MLQISEIVRKTEEMFDLFNEHFYEGELSRPAITVSPDGGRGAYVWCSINEIWNVSRLPVEGTTKGGSKKSINRSIKYVCPCCGTIIRATREVNVICGDCREAFERE